MNVIVLRAFGVWVVHAMLQAPGAQIFGRSVGGIWQEKYFLCLVFVVHLRWLQAKPCVRAYAECSWNTAYLPNYASQQRYML